MVGGRRRRRVRRCESRWDSDSIALLRVDASGARTRAVLVDEARRIRTTRCRSPTAACSSPFVGLEAVGSRPTPRSCAGSRPDGSGRAADPGVGRRPRDDRRPEPRRARARCRAARARSPCGPRSRTTTSSRTSSRAGSAADGTPLGAPVAAVEQRASVPARGPGVVGTERRHPARGGVRAVARPVPGHVDLRRRVGRRAAGAGAPARQRRRRRSTRSRSSSRRGARRRCTRASRTRQRCVSDPASGSWVVARLPAWRPRLPGLRLRARRRAAAAVGEPDVRARPRRGSTIPASGVGPAVDRARPGRPADRLEPGHAPDARARSRGGSAPGPIRGRPRSRARRAARWRRATRRSRSAPPAPGRRSSAGSTRATGRPARHRGRSTGLADGVHRVAVRSVGARGLGRARRRRAGVLARRGRAAGHHASRRWPTRPRRRRGSSSPPTSTRRSSAAGTTGPGTSCRPTAASARPWRTARTSSRSARPTTSGRREAVPARHSGRSTRARRRRR